MTLAEKILTPDGTRFIAPDRSLLSSLAMINQQPDELRDQIYQTLLVDELLERYAIQRQTLRNPQGERVVTFDTSPSIGMLEMRVWRQLSDQDPLLYMQLVDTNTNQINILLFITSDPESPRFSVDRDWGGEPTKFGTLSRNLEAEVAAMQAGLSPGQVRKGLRLARKMLPNFEQFISRLGYDLYLMEPLAYHSAVLFENFGYTYSQGRRRMEKIHQGFQPGGEYFQRLDGSTPFRQAGAEKTVRGRSWAIHDGILGEPYTDYHMYKHLGKHAGVSTFPNYVW
ncbi:hypothetical protein TFLX_03783 [Thermoflexales bacterium]|nr:hypothetical protein TFLX_03783 [Thermoflexales bacterium]